MEFRIGRHASNVPNVWFSSDAHFGHTNIIRYSNRCKVYNGERVPFANAGEMDDTIISRYNEMIKEDDILCYLGDWCFHDRYRDNCSMDELAERYRQKINCKTIYFVFGNHDKKMRSSDKFRHLWRGSYDILDVEVDGQRIVLCHYAMRCWDRSHHSSFHLYGHSHGDLPEDQSYSFDVGVDNFDFYPVSFEDVKNKMAYKKWGGAGSTIHHHGREG